MVVLNPMHGGGDVEEGSSSSSWFGGGGNKDMFGREKPSTTGDIGAKANAAGAKLTAAATAVAAGEVPTFTEPSAFDMCCPGLTYKQRMYGFVGSCAFGWVLSLMGCFVLIGGPTQKNIAAFAVLFVVGNIVALMGTGFLLGPKTQCRKMWDPTRRFSAAFYLSMLIIVFALAVSGQNVGLVICMLILEVCAASWYGLSYIPFGRKIVITFVQRTFGCGGGAAAAAG